MCGIFGYIGTKNNAAEMVLEGLKLLEYRGYDSWGVAVVPLTEVRGQRSDGSDHKLEVRGINDKIVVKKKIGRIGNANVADLPLSNFAFGHTRWATHGGVTDINAHPHLDCSGNLALIHNGIIENYENIKKGLIKTGHRFISETDTEVAVHLIEEFMRKKIFFSKAVQKAFNELEGLNAIIVLSSQDHTFVVARNGSPLVVGFGAEENYLASDAAAMLPYTKQVHYLEDDQMAIVDQKDIKIFNVKTGATIHPKKQRLTWTVDQVEKGDFPFFIIKEIHEQPGIVADIASTAVSQAEKLARIIKKSYGAYIVGCGTSSHACGAAAYLFSKIAKEHVNFSIGSEFNYLEDYLTKDTLVIPISQSGETIDVVEPVQKAKKKGIKIAAIVNVLGSSLYRQADFKFLLGAGKEVAVVGTKSFIAMISVLVLTAYTFAKKHELGKTLLLNASANVRKILKDEFIKNIKKVAQDLKNKEHIYIIGRGLSYAAALEAALKIKETSYIHAEGFAAGELKHGVIALIDKGTPCVVIAPNDETYDDIISNAEELKARGGIIIGIGPKNNKVFDRFFETEDLKEATIIPQVVISQLIAYNLAIEKGIKDPDKPRNLAKSVTVK